MKALIHQSYSRNIWILGLIFHATLVATRGATYYVSPSGNDTGPGTSEFPFQTIQRGADVVDPGDTVIVRDGVYTRNHWAVVVLTQGGSLLGGWVTFKSENKYGAVLDGQNDATRLYGFISQPPGVSYVRIQDFEIRNFSKIAILIEPPSIAAFDVSGNYIHHIGRVCSDEDVGFVGVLVDKVSSVSIQKNIIHDIGRFCPGENSCAPLSDRYKSRDHGVYVDGCSGVTIKNNIFYNIKRGWGVHVYSGSGVRSSSVLIANNTFAFPNPYLPGQIVLAYPGLDNANIVNNIFYCPNNAAVRISPDTPPPTFSGVTISTNLIHGGVIKWPAGSTSGVTITGNVEKDALMVNPNCYDFRLQAGSEAIDKGAAMTGLVTDDIDGNSRGPAWDIGAYEYTP